MKNTVWSMAVVLFFVSAAVIIFTIDGRRIREQEIVESLSQAAESSMEMLLSEKYTILDNREFIADFIQALLLQIQSDSTIQVNVLDVDEVKGILSVEVVQSFKHPNGKPGKVSCVKTVILDEKEESIQKTPKEKCEVIYKIPDEDGIYVVYKQYRIEKGKEIIIPKNPTYNEKTFLNWQLDGSDYSIVNADNQKVTINKDITLTAKFN